MRNGYTRQQICLMKQLQQLWGQHRVALQFFWRIPEAEALPVAVIRPKPDVARIRCRAARV